ncbi:MAG: hypothetical protein P4L31_01565 [Candidatus Babeliales bacterium]|nr:hypothetical protein [Candidatus Babeliales bacterium]
MRKNVKSKSIILIVAIAYLRALTASAPAPTTTPSPDRSPTNLTPAGPHTPSSSPGLATKTSKGTPWMSLKEARAEEISPKAYLNFAKIDLCAAKLLNDALKESEITSIDQLANILFFAQQAAEKALKGHLHAINEKEKIEDAERRKLESSHNLQQLAEKINSSQYSIKINVSQAESLTLYQNSPRYPDVALSGILEEINEKLMAAYKAKEEEPKKNAQREAKDLANKAIEYAENIVRDAHGKFATPGREHLDPLRRFPAPKGGEDLCPPLRPARVARRELFASPSSGASPAQTSSSTTRPPKNLFAKGLLNDSDSDDEVPFAQSSTRALANACAASSSSAPAAKAFQLESSDDSDSDNRRRLAQSSLGALSSSVQASSCAASPSNANLFKNKPSITSRLRKNIPLSKKWLDSAKIALHDSEILVSRSTFTKSSTNEGSILTLAEQAVEKALKALWLLVVGGDLSETHNIKVLTKKILREQMAAATIEEETKLALIKAEEEKIKKAEKKENLSEPEKEKIKQDRINRKKIEKAAREAAAEAVKKAAAPEEALKTAKTFAQAAAEKAMTLAAKTEQLKIAAEQAETKAQAEEADTQLEQAEEELRQAQEKLRQAQEDVAIKQTEANENTRIKKEKERERELRKLEIKTKATKQSVAKEPAKDKTEEEEEEQDQKALDRADKTMKEISAHARPLEKAYLESRYPSLEKTSFELGSSQALKIAKEAIDYVEQYIAFIIDNAPQKIKP